MKTILTACLIAGPLLAINANAQNTTVWNPAANPASKGLWNEAANWTGGAVPGTADKVVLNVNGAVTCVIKSIASPGQLVIGDGGPGSVVIASGGTLTTGNNWTGLGYNNTASLEIQTGGSATFNDHLWVGLTPGAAGTLTMNGGTAMVKGMFGLGWDGGKGTALIKAGTLNLAQWHPTDSIKGDSQMDITGGKVVITGDVTSSVDAFAATSQLVAYGGRGTLVRTFDSAANATTLTALKPEFMGPYPSTAWPATVNPAKKVHYCVTDGYLPPPVDAWNNSVGLVDNGDQALTDAVLKGYSGKRAASNFINIYDSAYQEWNSFDHLDILFQVYGDASVLRPGDASQTRRISFLVGTVPHEMTVDGGTFVTNAYNGKWNWILFTIPNPLIDSGPNHKIGFVPDGSLGDTRYGGVNGGTIRLQGPDNNVNGLAVHAIAIGEPGAFGVQSDINQFEAPDQTCGPVPASNLVGIDFNAGVTNHLKVLNSDDQTVVMTNTGPATDRRKAVIPTSTYLNFGIPDYYLGKPCHDNAIVKICIDFYDDPAFANMGVQFGPELYAADENGSPSLFPQDQMHLMEGSGKWIRRAWLIPSCNLAGINTTPLTGGPRILSYGGQVAVSRYEMGIIRTGTHPLAGQDPLSDCYTDIHYCDDTYGNFVELDLANNIKNGLDVGTSGGDQNMVVEQAGPADDRRMAVRPSFGDSGAGTFLNFVIQSGALGPSTQPNNRLAIVVTYYDDPALTGKGFRPQVWKTDSATGEGFNYMQPNGNIVLQGTDKWRTAYWEIGSIKFSGVNQSPQAAARFSMDDRIYVSRVRYAVIRPCGSDAGKNKLDVEKPQMTIATQADGQVKAIWPYHAPLSFLQSINAVGEPWVTFPGTPTVEDQTNHVFKFAPAQKTQLFRVSNP